MSEPIRSDKKTLFGAAINPPVFFGSLIVLLSLIGTTIIIGEPVEELFRTVQANISDAAKNNLMVVAEDDLESGINRLSSTLEFYKNDLSQNPEGLSKNGYIYIDICVYIYIFIFAYIISSILDETPHPTWLRKVSRRET